MGNNVIPIKTEDTWLASFDLFRDRNGFYKIVLSDARKSLIEQQPSETDQKIKQIGEMLELGIVGFKASAASFEEST